MAFYRGTLEAWLRWLGGRAEAGLDSIGREDVVEWRNAEAKRVSPKTVNHRLKAVRKLLGDGVKEGFLSVNVAVGVERVRSGREEREGKRARRPFTMEELRAVEGVADQEWRVILWLGVFTGQRLGDVLRLKWGDFDVGNRSVGLVAGKTGKRMWIPLPGWVVGLLVGWRDRSGKGDDGGWVFPGQVAALKGNGDRVGMASKVFAHLLWKAGLRGHSPYGAGLRGRKKGVGSSEGKVQSSESGGGRRVVQELSFHSLRHTARSVLEVAGVPKAVIDAYVGHDGDTGRAYTTVGEAALRAAAAALEGVVSGSAQKKTPSPGGDGG